VPNTKHALLVALRRECNKEPWAARAGTVDRLLDDVWITGKSSFVMRQFLHLPAYERAWLSTVGDATQRTLKALRALPDGDVTMPGVETKPPLP